MAARFAVQIKQAAETDEQIRYRILCRFSYTELYDRLCFEFIGSSSLTVVNLRSSRTVRDEM